MKITSRFTVAVHTLLVIYKFGNEYKITSEFIAASVNVNPVVIRRALQSLKAAGLVEVKAGSGGARTGEYLLGGEEYFVNDRGMSEISYADYAIAMIDEIEKANHIQERFSVIGK